MAETIVVQRGQFGTHNMHVYAGETALSHWASIEAQNTGYIAGNWQSHLVCTPNSEKWEVSHPYDDMIGGMGKEQLNLWRITWPALGSYTRLSFTALSGPDWLGEHKFDFGIRLYDADYTASFYDGTVLESFDQEEAKRITFHWDMDDSGLAAHIDTGIYIQLFGGRELYNPLDWGWTFRFYEFLIVTANCPL
ncbi:MAG: hypothetical protein KOO60_11055 [Gemmatimonadales bacterium]|nr:hypothetical protein [Gemmatimonadales bacterium]